MSKCDVVVMFVFLVCVISACFMHDSLDFDLINFYVFRYNKNAK